MQNMQLWPKIIQHKASETISMAWIRNKKVNCLAFSTKAGSQKKIDLPVCASPRGEPCRQCLLVLEGAKKVRFYTCLRDICRYFSIIVSDARRIGHHLLACWSRVGGWPPYPPLNPPMDRPLCWKAQRGLYYTTALPFKCSCRTGSQSTSITTAAHWSTALSYSVAQ